MKKESWVFPVNDFIPLAFQKLHDHLKTSKRLVLTNKDNMLFYKKGLYRRISPNEVKALIKSFLPVELRNHKNIEEVFYGLKTDFSDIREDEFDSNEDIINFKNGILNLLSGKLEPHNPKWFSTIQIPCDYNPLLTLDNAPYFKKFTEDLFGDDVEARCFVFEYMGAILSNIKGWRFKKLLMLIGVGNTGKTLLLELIQNLLGKENCVSIDFKKMNERFGTAPLYGKRLNGVGDLAFVELEEINTIKELTGGDTLSAEFKGKDSFNFQYNGFIWCNGNRLPYFRGDRGKHVYERFCIVNCDNAIPPEKRDAKLLEKMLNEKEAIVSVLIEHLINVLPQGYRFTEGESIRIARDKYEIENNSLLTFVKECCDLTGETPRPEFNTYYETWCKTNEIRAERDKERRQQLLDIFHIEAHKKNGAYIYDLTIREEYKLELGAMKADFR